MHVFCRQIINIKNILQKAEAEMAFELQAAKTKQRIMEEQMQVKVVERSQEIAVQEQEMLRRERELDATIRRPADAEKYRYTITYMYLQASQAFRYI